MAVATAVARTKRNGTLTIRDGAGTPLVVTIAFEEGDLNADLRATDYQVVRARGAVQHFILGDDPIYQGSFTAHVTEFLGSATPSTFSDLLWTQVFASTNPSIGTTTGTSGEPKVFDLRLTLADPDGVGNETITWPKCVFPTMQISEGYPSKISVTFQARGIPTFVYNAS